MELPTPTASIWYGSSEFTTHKSTWWWFIDKLYCYIRECGIHLLVFNCTLTRIVPTSTPPMLGSRSIKYIRCGSNRVEIVIFTTSNASNIHYVFVLFFYIPYCDIAITTPAMNLEWKRRDSNWEFTCLFVAGWVFWQCCVW